MPAVTFSGICRVRYNRLAICESDTCRGRVVWMTNVGLEE